MVLHRAHAQPEARASFLRIRHVLIGGLPKEDGSKTPMKNLKPRDPDFSIELNGCEIHQNLPKPTSAHGFGLAALIQAEPPTQHLLCRLPKASRALRDWMERGMLAVWGLGSWIGKELELRVHDASESLGFRILRTLSLGLRFFGSSFRT